jgi:hypothetical protein
MVVNVRTHDDLRDLLRNRASGNWVIGVATEPSITMVRVFNWNMDQVLKGDFSRERSRRDAIGKLIIGISKSRIENFRAYKSWVELFGSAAVAYTPYVPVKKQNDEVTGVLRDANFGEMNKNEIDEFFKRLKAEIQLRGLNKIVFKAGGVPIPDSFRQWCQENNIEIEVIPEDELNRQYPIDNDILWEDDLFDEDQQVDNRD